MEKEELKNQTKNVKMPNKEILEKYLMQDKIYVLDEKIMFKIIPELEDTYGFDQKHPHHSYDVWNHTLKALERARNDLEIRLSLLLHDIGKPHSYQEENGIRHFKGHAKKSAQITKDILIRLGYDEKQIKNICYLVENHDNIIDVNQIDETNKELFKKLLHIQYADAYAHHPDHIEKRIKKLDEIKLQIEEKFKQKEDTDREVLEKLLLSQFNSEKITLDKEVIFKIIPELEITDGFDQKNDYHIYDVWNHIAKAVEKSKSNLEIRLALLLHDIGKPHSYQEENGIRHFKGHPEKSTQIAKDILIRLGYDKKQIEDICFLIGNHAKTIDVENVNEENLEITKKLLHIQYCDAYAYNPEYLRDVLDKLDVIYRKLEIKEKEINNQEDKGER